MELKNDLETISYVLGIHFGEYLKGMPLPVDHRLAAQGLQDCFAGTPALTREDYAAAMQLCRERMNAAARQKAGEAAQKNAASAAAFLAANARADGVQTTPSGLQYLVLTEGKGRKPAATDTVRVHYVGTLLDGTEFDSSLRRGEPAEFALHQVIPGWTEGVQLMPVGSKYRFFIPPALAYGEQGAGGAIPPNAALIFEVELLDILS